ncbi:MAG: alanine dehydrogenase, partial [Myxococcota bacterium]
MPAETANGERRVALTPDAVKALVKDGISVAVQAGAGAEAGFDDTDY